MGIINDYLASIEDKAGQAALRHLAEVVRKVLPDVGEGVSYAMPAFMYRGKPLASLMATKQHLAYYPFSGKVVDELKDRLAGFSLSSGTIRFQPDHMLPDDILREGIRLRIAEIDALERPRR